MYQNIYNKNKKVKPDQKLKRKKKKYINKKFMDRES